MTLNFLMGALLGSAVFITAGGPPARRILARVQRRLGRGSDPR